MKEYALKTGYGSYNWYQASKQGVSSFDLAAYMEQTEKHYSPALDKREEIIQKLLKAIAEC